jgi:hypothetical protein
MAKKKPAKTKKELYRQGQSIKARLSAHEKERIKAGLKPKHPKTAVAKKKKATKREPSGAGLPVLGTPHKPAITMGTVSADAADEAPDQES